MSDVVGSSCMSLMLSATAVFVGVVHPEVPSVWVAAVGGAGLWLGYALCAYSLEKYHACT